MSAQSCPRKFLVFKETSHSCPNCFGPQPPGKGSRHCAHLPRQRTKGRPHHQKTTPPACFVLGAIDARHSTSGSRHRVGRSRRVEVGCHRNGSIPTQAVGHVTLFLPLPFPFGGLARVGSCMVVVRMRKPKEHCEPNASDFTIRSLLMTGPAHILALYVSVRLLQQPSLFRWIAQRSNLTWGLVWIFCSLPIP